MKQYQFFILAHNIRSLLNVGSIFRTAESLGVTKIYLSGYTGTPKHPRLAKTALGAEQFMDWEYQKSSKRVITKLRKDYPKLKVIGLENNLSSSKLKTLDKFKPTFPLLLVLGEEVKGIPKSVRDLCDGFVQIPMRGKKESLNVAVAFGIAAYEISDFQVQKKKKIVIS